METINILYVYYGDGEYTSYVTNQDLAKQYATLPEYRAQWPLLVNTVEHGGWSMTHYFDSVYQQGICVGTANDRARFHPNEENLRQQIYNARRQNVGDIRRPRRNPTVAA